MSAAIDARMHSRAANNRAFSYAVLFSLLFHATLLFLFSHRQPKAPPVTPGPIVARLAPPSTTAPIAAPAQPEPPKPQREEATPPPEVKPLPKASPAPAKPPPAAKPKAKSAPVSPAPPVPPAEPAKPSAQPAPSVPAPATAPAGPVARADPAPSAPTAPAPDAGTLETYRMDLLSMARKYKRYPRVAMDNNWEGRVVVRMVIGANGLISSITITTTSGHEVLDKQAIDMIQKAKPRVQIPAALRGKEFPVDIPVIYSLKDSESG